MGALPIAIGVCFGVSALALACAVLAALRSRASATSSEVRRLLDQARAQAMLWESAAKALQREVGFELERLESKRRAVAGVESRLKSRQETEDVEGARVEQEQEQPDADDLSRADLRALRRSGHAA